MATPPFVLDLREKIGDHPLWLPGVKGVVLRPGTAGADAEVLLVQRRDNGRWTVPAGILEPGEEPADGIVREVFEETGVRAVPLRLVGVQALPPTVYPNGDRAQYPFGLQIADDRRRRRAQGRRHRDNGRRPAGDRPARDDEDDGPQAP